ncbi:MAG: GPW/gp25 family protein [Trueperaceae bacterium]|nr:GPW/gp25 family protein [Trueperaceae bacterium]
MSTELYGQGVQWPPEADDEGRLVLSSGEARIWESIEQILDTPKGTCPMDPGYGVDLNAYDPVTQPEQVAWRVANALEANEPRIDDLEVAIVNADASEGLLELDIRVLPIGSNTRTNRIFPLYRAS